VSTLAVSTPFNIDLELAIAPFGKRLGAWAIDIAVLLLYTIAFYQLVFDEIYMDENTSTFVGLLAFGVPWALYDFLQEVFFHGQSIGKRAVGIRVVDIGGAEASVSQLMLRSVLRIVDFAPATFGLPALISALVTKNSQRIGDLVAGTVVIERGLRVHIGQTIYQAVDEQNYHALYPQVMRLTDRDLNGIRNLLNVRATKDTEIYAAQVAHRIKEVLGIESNLETRRFLEKLLEDYNYLSGKR